jgi:hypothetical protein
MTGGVWTALNTGIAGYPQVYTGGAWTNIFKLYQMQSGSWALIYTTAKYGPALPPQWNGTPGITAISSHRVTVTLTQPLPATYYNTYDLKVRVVNNTNSAFNTTFTVSPANGTATYTTSSVGNTGDSVTVDMYYQNTDGAGPHSTTRGATLIA